MISAGGEFNFFIFTDDPAKTFDVVREVLASDIRKYNMRAAYQERDGETYNVLWPREPGFSQAAEVSPTKAGSSLNKDRVRHD